MDEEQKKPVIIDCEPEQFDDTLSRLKEMAAEFISLSASGTEQEGIKLHYYFQKGRKMIVIRVKVPDKVISSLYSCFQKSDFIEREINNVFGVKFLGHPNLERIKSLEKKSRQDYPIFGENNIQQRREINYE